MKNKNKIEFGDFQTPQDLSDKVCNLLVRQGVNPITVIEPTCGKGNFVFSSLKEFKNFKQIICNEINPTYVQELIKDDRFQKSKKNLKLMNEDFFLIDWENLSRQIKEPIVFIGNPPWVTNSTLGAIKGSNLPEKNNFLGLKGFDALTGGSNFDISEAMLIGMVNILKYKEGYIAMLIKTSVARKVLAYIWKNNIGISESSIYHLDATKSFDVSVDACLFFCEFSKEKTVNFDTKIFSSLDSKMPDKIIGYRDNQLVADIEAYNRIASFVGIQKDYVWRSGIKHDCSKVMELTKKGDKYINGFDEQVDIEETFLYPMLKSSDVANNREPSRWVIVTQKKVGENTEIINKIAPKTWKYLLSYSDFLDKRGSSIYKKNVRFSIFGVGEYTFSDWKIAISGFYKNPLFRIVGKNYGKPTVFDDTCYFLPCRTRGDAEEVVSILNSQIGKDFINAFAFWDSKRPITSNFLNKINIHKVFKM